MVGSNGVDFLDLVGERGRFVGDQLDEIMRGRLARKKLKELVHRARPGCNHADGKLPGFTSADEDGRGESVELTMHPPMGSSPTFLC